jgi:FMN phosphatase YigB (HAD superfamily)
MIKAIFFDLFETLVTEADGVKITSSIIAERLKIPLYEYVDLK